MFTTPNAKRIVLGTLVLTGVISVVRDIAHQEVPDVARLLIGLIFAGVLLSLASEAVPEVAALFAVLILVGTLLESGPVVLSAATARITPKKGTLV